MNREQNIADTKALFEGWELYQIAIANNYMIHQEIIDCLGDQLSKTGGTACSVLEIGCGDSYVISEIAKSTNIDRYVGIDLSTRALEFGRDNLANRIPNIELLQGDMYEKIGSIDSRFDLIVAGYSIHHLNAVEKKNLFNILRSKLSFNGFLIVYDIVSEEKESREAFLNRSAEFVTSEWTQFTSQQSETLKEHILNNDYPESWTSWSSIALESGYATTNLLYRDSKKLFGIMKFT